MGYSRPDTPPPSPPPDISDIFKRMDACLDGSQACIDETDDYLSAVFSDNPDFATLQDEYGNLPLWRAFTQKLNKTLRVIIDLNTTPRVDNRIVYRYSVAGHLKFPIFLSDKIDYLIIRNNDDQYREALQLAHQLLPFMYKADFRVLMNALLEEALSSPQPITALRRLIEDDFDLSVTKTTERENFINLFITKLPRELIPQLLNVKGMLFCNTVVEKLRLILPHLARMDRKEFEKFALFLKTYKSMTTRSRFYSLQLFSNDFIALLDQGVDLRHYRYDNNKTLIQLVTELPHASATLDFLQKIDKPVRQLYLPSLPGAPRHIEENNSSVIANTLSLDMD